MFLIDKPAAGIASEGKTDTSTVEGSGGGAFSVQRGRAVPTLSSVVNAESAKEQQNQDTKSEERGEEGSSSASSSGASLLMCNYQNCQSVLYGISMVCIHKVR